MPDKIKIARLSLKIGGVLFFAAALLFLFILIDGYVLAGLGGAERRLLGNRLLGAAGVLLLAASVAAGVSCLRAAAGLALREKRARAAGLGLGFLLLPLLPFGPVLGAFVLSGLLGGDARAWFPPSGGPSPAGPVRRDEVGEAEGARSDDEKRGP